MLNRLRRRYKKWPVDVVMDDEQDAPLVNGCCPKCERPWDSHEWRRQRTDRAICPGQGEAISGEPRGPEIDLSWLVWLMDEETEDGETRLND